MPHYLLLSLVAHIYLSILIFALYVGKALFTVSFSHLSLSPLHQAKDLQTSGLHTRARLLGTGIKQTIPDGVKWLRAKAQSRFNHSNFLEFITKNIVL